MVLQYSDTAWTAQRQPSGKDTAPGHRTGWKVTRAGTCHQFYAKREAAPVLDWACRVPLLSLTLPSQGMHEKPREPKAMANCSAGLPMAKHSTQLLLGTSPMATPRCSTWGWKQHLLHLGQVPHTYPFPQPHSCLLLIPHCIAPELQLAPTAHTRGAPREAACPHLGWGASRAKGALPRDRDSAPAKLGV